MGGIVGRLFREFAVTLSVAIAALAGRLADHHADDVRRAAAAASRARHGRGRRGRASAWSTRCCAATTRSLRWALRHPRTMLAVTLADRRRQRRSLHRRAEGLLPAAGHRPADRRRSRPTRTSRSRRCWDKLPRSRAIIGARSRGRQRDGVHRRRRRRRLGQEHGAHVRRPQAVRPARRSAPTRSSPACARSWPTLPGAPTFLQPVQDLRIGGRLGNAQYQYTLQGERFDELAAWAPRVAAAPAHSCRSSPTSTATSRTQGLQASLVVDRDTAARLDVSPQRIDDTLYDAFGQRQVSTIYAQLNQYHVVMEVEPRFWQQPGDAARPLRRAPTTARRCRSSALRALRADARRRWRSTTRGSSRR